MIYDPNILLQIAIIAIGGLNAWVTVKTRLEVAELKVYMHENFITKGEAE